MNPHIEFIDLQAQRRRISTVLQERMQRVVEQGHYIMGPEVQELEDRLARFVGAKHCVSCANGTDALMLALMALGVGPGDEVITTPFTFIATAEVVSLLGARPLFVDIDEASFNIDPAKLKSFLEQARAKGTHTRIKGIIPVDLFGLPAEYDELAAIAREHKLFVLEDAAQSFGATYRGKRVGRFGDIAATSFFPAKPLGCYGDGGAIFTDNTGMADHIKSLRIHGKGTDKYDNVRVGMNSRLDTLQAAVLLAKMDVFDDEIERRNAVAKRYAGGLASAVAVPTVPNDRTSVWAQYTVRHAERDRVLTGLKTRGVPTAIYYPKPLHLQGAFAGLGYAAGAFPVSERAAGTVFSLPMHPYLEESVQATIIEAVLAVG